MVERVVHFPARTVFAVVAIVLSVAATLEVLWIARHVLTWVLISLFLALALNPAVEWLQRHHVRSRGLAVAVTYLGVAIVVVAIGASFVPTLVHQVNSFVDKLPSYIDDLTSGKGRLGFLETKYHVVEKVREQVHKGGASRVLGLSGTALAVTKGVINIVVGTVTIVFMTFFMLLEGPRWTERIFGLLPAESQPRWRKVGHDIYRTVGGYVTGNLLISLIAGVSSTLVLLVMGVPYAVALGLIVAILDLIPLAGATIAAIIVATVAFLHSIVAGIVVIVFFVVYQQVENHVLQPVVYGRTVQLSPLAVLIAVLIGAELAGVLGALAAIPVAGAIQVILVDWLRYRREQLLARPGPEAAGEAELPA
ncbi:MAG: AI-2E family transporter [Actinobacteria bacterium]|nr:MAG: AI-2E family transporter [Actinomycetota bacterium]